MRKLSVVLCLLLVSGAPAMAAGGEYEGYDLYRRGLYEEAMLHWTKAADAGDAGSAYRLAMEYYDAKVVKQNLTRVRRYLEQAAAEDDPRALHDLGSLYDNGVIVRLDRRRAAELYLRSAQLGYAAAMFNIAVMLERGEGIREDKIEAYKYYLLSKSLGFGPFADQHLEILEPKLSPAQRAEGQDRADNFTFGTL